MGISGPGIPFTPIPDTNVAFDTTTDTVTSKYPATATSTLPVTITINGDNGGTSFVDSVGDCFHRVISNFSQVEWGAYGDKIHDDVLPPELDECGPAAYRRSPAIRLSNIPSSAAMADSRIRSAFRVRLWPTLADDASSMPTFNIHADKNSWNDATDPQMFLMSGGAKLLALRRRADRQRDQRAPEHIRHGCYRQQRRHPGKQRAHRRPFAADGRIL